MQSFAIQTDIFSGPLELLIELVEKRKLLINDISLAEVTDEYIRHVSEMQEQSLPHTAQFVALAATLLLIKSKSLLPVLELTSEETESIEELEERLRLFQIYREAAQIVETAFGTNISHERTFVPAKKPLFITDAYTETAALAEAIQGVLHELPQIEEKPKVKVAPIISLEAMIDRLATRIQTHMKLRYSELVADAPEKKTAIVGFLAILESVKQGMVLVRQIKHFDDIEIEHAQLGVPQYYER